MDKSVVEKAEQAGSTILGGMVGYVAGYICELLITEGSRFGGPLALVGALSGALTGFGVMRTRQKRVDE